MSRRPSLFRRFIAFLIAKFIFDNVLIPFWQTIPESWKSTVKNVICDRRIVGAFFIWLGWRILEKTNNGVFDFVAASLCFAIVWIMIYDFIRVENNTVLVYVLCFCLVASMVVTEIIREGFEFDSAFEDMLIYSHVNQADYVHAIG